MSGRNRSLTTLILLFSVTLLQGYQEIIEQKFKDYMQIRSKIIQQLLLAAQQKPGSVVDIKTQIRIVESVRMLGELRAIEAIAFLVEHIAMSFPLLGTGTAERGVETDYPAVGALIRIGYPSVREILNRGFLRERNDLEQKLMAHVIRSILGQGYQNSQEVGTRLGRLIIQEHLRSVKPSASVRDRLVKFMEKHFPVEKPVKRR